MLKSQWLAEVENAHAMILIIADRNVTPVMIYVTPVMTRDSVTNLIIVKANVTRAMNTETDVWTTGSIDRDQVINIK